MHHLLVLVRKFFHTEDSNDILKFLVSLQDLLYSLSCVVMLITKYFSI